MADLTAAETKFFETGELPEELAAPAVETSAPAPTPAPAPAPNVEPNADFLQQALAEERQRFQLTQERLIALERQLQEKLNPPLPVPDAELDPLGNMMHKLDTVSSALTSVQQQQLQEQQNRALQAQFEQFTASVRAVKEAFEKTTPDFNDAYTHIRNIRTADLRSVGVPESEIPKVLLQDELNIAQAALQRGKNPAEEMYNMAKRYGYNAKAVADPTKQVANLLKGQEAAKTVPRGAADTELTVESLKDASDSDLSKMVQDDKLWSKLAGGITNDIFGG